jgi:hypothetical protein
MSTFVGMLMNSRTQAHYFHLRSVTYAQHKALQKYYEQIVPLMDAYAEAYPKKIRAIKINRRFLQDPTKAPAYFRSLLARMKKMKLSKEPHLKNIQDDIVTLIHTTLYLLRLK